MSDAPTDSVEARIETLEIRIAHLEHTLLELSDELVRQQVGIERHLEAYRRLLENMDTAPGGAAATQFEIPPHY